ncbi:RodZ domain-containing protein [Psychrobacter sp. Ps3]|jgi:cytoskeletal protein RodZ|uniref:helix-turn-helix domain-containing protein n=1 Tax=Psychrobacter sp. Ps3 TaxID=2790957 RepID=UPI001EDC9E08|nr:RodZ domain-containing protein [Psychrobacter sp. Ps3]
MAMTEPSLNTQLNAQNSFGAMLQQARNTQQISLETAAAELFILKRHLQALENENFAELPQVAFARGFAINYAKYLRLDPNTVASAFDAAYPNELKDRSANNTESLLQPMGTLQRDTSSRIRINPLLIIGVIVLIVLAFFLFRMVSNASRDSETAAPVIDDITATEQAQGAAVVTDDDSIGASGSALNLGDDSQSNATLEVKLTDAVDVNIADASGNSLMNGEQTRGNYTLIGVPPFSIQIDDVDNASLVLDQQAVALEQYTTGNRAIFELAP